MGRLGEDGIKAIAEVYFMRPGTGKVLHLYEGHGGLELWAGTPAPPRCECGEHARVLLVSFLSYQEVLDYLRRKRSN